MFAAVQKYYSRKFITVNLFVRCKSYTMSHIDTRDHEEL
jgi:hypothetical protein